MSGFGALEIAVGGEAVRVEGFAVDFGETAGAEVLVFYDPPGAVTLHVYGREIADGALACTLGGRRAAVRMDLRLAARIVTEGLMRGMELSREEAEALGAALAAGE